MRIQSNTNQDRADGNQTAIYFDGRYYGGSSAGRGQLLDARPDVLGGYFQAADGLDEDQRLIGRRRPDDAHHDIGRPGGARRRERHQLVVTVPRMYHTAPIQRRSCNQPTNTTKSINESLNHQLSNQLRSSLTQSTARVRSGITGEESFHPGPALNRISIYIFIYIFFGKEINLRQIGRCGAEAC